MQRILSNVKTANISAVSCVANSKDSNSHDNRSFIQGLEKLALAMQGKRYTGIILANSTSQEQLSSIRRSYEEIYTQLIPFAKSQISYSSNNSMSVSESSSLGKSISTSITNTHGLTKTTGTSVSVGVSDSTSSPSIASKAVSGLAAASSILGAALAVPTGGASLAIGGVVSGGLGLLGTAIQRTDSHGTNRNEAQNESDSVNDSIAKGETAGETETKTDTRGITSGTGENITLNIENKVISNILDRLDTQLDRLQEFESLGMWECAAYFMSDDTPTDTYSAEIAASTYKALMRGENSGVEVSAINTWNKTYSGEKTALLREYLLRFIHPVFNYNSPNGYIEVTPCSLVSGNELALHMGLPRRSVCGFPVIEHADFGKEVNYAEGVTPTASVNLGKVFNMGRPCSNSVRLDRKSFTMHTFVTGSTGSGKSNTIYELLRQFMSVDVSFMVVEPAKGEYKNVFGNYPGVRVLGTNPTYSELLQINPFRFPTGIHVLEHVDRLIEIFNVCWPMYAAMPAVLKDAVLQSYQVCGWDLIDSTNSISDDLFPTFQDLQTELINVIESSAYSQEVKSNYIGSLATRVKSLANGLNGQIFSANEIDNKILFDKNVIIDLSRIGSLETKSLIMGVLIMRLNEHRISNATGMNSPLKHITVLEEAHNILKKTSGEQNPESPSVAGKSVEMLSNAIAEMRTYGEGFIIADQSPSAVDISAIRNTNTKIIMRLPDETDRRLAGKSAALKEEQLDEIAKLPKGVAVVYQNDWLEPVLCKVNKFNGKEAEYQYTPAPKASKCDDKWVRSEILTMLIKGRLADPQIVDIDTAELFRALPYATLSTKNKLGISQLIREFVKTGHLKLWADERFGELSNLVVELLDCRASIAGKIQNSLDFDELTDAFREIISKNVFDASNDLVLAISQCFMKDYTTAYPERIEIYAAWRESVLQKGVF